MTQMTRYLTQTVSYLGFLEAKLRDLQGIGTLVYELVQNADDARDEAGLPAADWICFDVQDGALVVENNGRFLPTDFLRLQHIASGGKRAEAETTGAFGLGFIAVYQVTDAPEIFSSGKQWTIYPDAPADQRILEQEVATNGTILRLPWASTDSAVRRALRLDAIPPSKLPDLTAEIANALPLAALFLKNLRVLELKRNGEVVKRVERGAKSEERGVLWCLIREETALASAHINSEVTTWHLLTADFQETADSLRAAHQWQIEENRRSQIWVAIPDKLMGNGRLFATLPSQSATPLPFHLNADFYPSTDRKRIVFGADYQSAWNRAAVRCAAQALAAHLGQLPALLGAVGLWHLLQQVETAHRQAAEGILDGVFAEFWQALAPLLPHHPLVFTASKAWLPPQEARLTTSEAETAVLPLLQLLGIPLVHPTLHPYTTLLRQVGVPLLRVMDVTAVLNRRIQPHTTLAWAPAPFNNLTTWQSLWRVLEVLLRRAPTREAHAQDTHALQTSPLTLTDMNNLAPAAQLARGKADTQPLFPRLQWLHPSLPADALPGNLVAEFSVARAIEYLSGFTQEELHTAWQQGELDPVGLYFWFEARQWEFVDEPHLKPQFRRLHIFPVFDQLYPLAHLYIPGGFEDPLQLSGLVDVAALDGRSDFLRDMGAQPLTFDAYVQQEVPRILRQHPDLRSDARHRLVQLLARRLGEFREDEEVQQILRPLPLVACLDGHFRPAGEVYADKQVTAVLGNQVHLAEPPSPTVQALYEWLGVANEARVADVVRMLSEERGARSEEREARMWEGWRCLNRALVEGRMVAEEVQMLRQKTAVPDVRHRLARPDALFFADDAALAARFPAAIQDNFLTPDETTRLALAAAGVQLLSQVAQLTIVETSQPEPDTLLMSRLRERRLLLRRVLAAEGGGENTAVLQSLHCLRTTNLTVCYTLQTADGRYTTPPEAVPVIFQASQNTLIAVHDNQTVPWAGIGRILASQLKPSGPIGGLASGLKEVLAATTPTEASCLLDELGYPVGR